ncbi:MAG: metallophosphoesterase family protein [Asticcacaulis sp.]
MAHDHPDDKGAPSRRHLLKCSAWAGTGIAWAMSGGVPRAFALDAYGKAPGVTRFLFVQISDTHIGFDKAANPDPLKTLGEATAKIRALTTPPSVILHTGDITHLSRPAEFDTAAQILGALPAPVRYVPGEHDTLDEGGGRAFLDRYGKGTKGNGWYSFDLDGVHFIALVNVFDFKPNQEASLGAEQLAWLKDDLRAVSKSTPLVVYTHIPLWDIYAPWGWGTSDAELAIAMLRPYGSVTVLNGHIHQIQQKVEGNITFHTARGTAYPQPAPGAAPSPGPMLVPPEQLRSYLGVSSITVTPSAHPLAISDTTLSDM